MKYISIIPARGGSKRFPNKNIYPLGGLPLIAHSIEYSVNNPLISETYVSTDSQAIKTVSEEFGAIVLDRPEKLGGDFVPTSAVLQDAAVQLLSQGVDFDYMVLLQATNPLRPNSLLEESIRVLEEEKYDSLMTVNKSEKKLGRIIDNKFCPWNYEFGQRSQDLEPLYYENGLLYISSKELILNGKIIGDKMYPMIVEHVFGQVDIDTKEDMEYAEYILDKQK